MSKAEKPSMHRRNKRKENLLDKVLFQKKGSIISPLTTIEYETKTVTIEVTWDMQSQILNILRANMKNWWEIISEGNKSRKD